MTINTYMRWLYDDEGERWIISGWLYSILMKIITDFADFYDEKWIKMKWSEEMT